MMFLTPSMAFQMGDAAFGGSLNSQSFQTLYLALRISMHKLSLLDATIQVMEAQAMQPSSTSFRCQLEKAMEAQSP